MPRACHSQRRADTLQRLQLGSFRLVRLIEPGTQRLRQRRPLVVGDREPSRVARTPLVDHGLPERAFMGEAEAFGGAPRRLVARVALPLIAPLPEPEPRLGQEI